jgi:hypothetical protein
MRFRSIEVDEDVWKFLKAKAEPFEDTPNSVLRRLLLNGKGEVIVKPMLEIPAIPRRSPEALRQILEVVYYVRSAGYTRTGATNFVAKKRQIAPQTVLDKYCRQLGKRADEVDSLLEQEHLKELETLLIGRFPNDADVIEQFLGRCGK